MSQELSGPRFVRYARPVIEVLQDLGGSGQPAEVKDLVAANMKLSDEELDITLKSGASRFGKDVEWARFYLANAGFIDSSRRGVWTLSDEGREYSLSHEETVELFSQIHKGFVEKRRQREVAQDSLEDEPEEDQLPEGGIDHRSELIRVILGLSDDGFERLCQRLLRESGFEKVTITGRSGDGGIDGLGVVPVNPFVSFKVLFQCKRYSGSVGPGKVRDFRGAMMGRADKGIILTTGTFTPAAREESVRDGVHPIELVDGDRLVEMFEELELGVRSRVSFEVDEDFFGAFN